MLSGLGTLHSDGEQAMALEKDKGCKSCRWVQEWDTGCTPFFPPRMMQQWDMGIVPPHSVVVS